MAGIWQWVRANEPKVYEKQEGLSISLHTNGNIISQCLWYLVVEQKEPLWKQLPRDPPSGRRDTACQDFQRGVAKKCYETRVIHFSLTLPRISWFRYYFNLSSPPPQLCVSLLMIPVWARLILEHCVHHWTCPPYLLCVGVRAPSGERAAQKACTIRMHYSIYDKTMCLSEWVSADSCW